MIDSKFSREEWLFVESSEGMKKTSVTASGKDDHSLLNLMLEVEVSPLSGNRTDLLFLQVDHQSADIPMYLWGLDVCWRL